jgi:predicted nucleotidyltransferase
MGDPVRQARDLVAERYPEALAAFLGGSTATGTATPTSDLDIAVLMPSGHDTLRDTTREDGRIVEWFVHTPDTVGRFIQEPDRRAVMTRVYGQGIVLADQDGAAARIAAEAGAILDAGPQPRDAAGREELRYALTDAFDDLTDATDPHEQLAVADHVVQLAGDLLCELRGGWTGRGKWLPRRLLEADPEAGGALLDAWLTLARGADAEPLLHCVRTLLTEAGGPLREGFRRSAPQR